MSASAHMAPMESQQAAPTAMPFTSAQAATYEDLVKLLTELNREHLIDHTFIIADGSMYSAFYTRAHDWILETGDPEERMVLSRGQWVYKPMTLSHIKNGPYTVLFVGGDQ